MYFRKGTIRSLAILAVAIASALAIATAASAGGSSQQIYNDYAKDGQINGHYSVAQLQSALHDSIAQGYPRANYHSAVQQQMAGVAGVQATQTPTQSGALPFTGLDVGVVVGVALLLIALGYGLRRAGRSTS
jgi:hypothetical protein